MIDTTFEMAADGRSSTMNTQPNQDPRPRPNQTQHTANVLHFKASGGPLPMHQLCYFEAAGNYTIIHTTDAKRPYVIIAYTMKQMCEWAPIMTRVRKGLAVNFAHVSSIYEGDVVMKQGQQFVVSRRYCLEVGAAWAATKFD